MNNGECWQALTSKGVRIQRSLWASISTKNPRYSDVCYVEPLIGPCTGHYDAGRDDCRFRRHGMVKENTVTEELKEAREVFQGMQMLGINFDRVTWQLENEGV